MLKVEAMEQKEIEGLLLRGGFGHLGCSRDGHPYVIPMHYAYDGEGIYILTTQGTKTEFIAANHEVCFQVEEISSPSNWRSAMVIGKAHRITKSDETERAMQELTKRNTTLTPALNQTDIGAWHRGNNLILYRIEPTELYGRKAGD